jgi:hypothetical protein
MRNLLVTVAVIGVGGYFGAKFYVQHKAAQDLDSMLDQIRPVVDVGYENVVATMNGELRVEGVTVRLPKFEDPLTVESVNVLTPGFLFLLGFDDDTRALEFPERLGIELEGLRASVDADFMRTLEDYRALQAGAVELTPADVCASTYGFTAASLKRLGYDEIAVDFSASFRRRADELTVDVGAHVEGMYELDLELTLGGIADPTAVVRGARPLLVGGRIDYTDRSLNGRIMKHCAEQQVTAEDVIAAQLREVQTLARETGMELDALIMQPYTDFLLGKQRFTLTSQPTKPVDLTRISLYKPSDVPNLLNLTAEAG